MLRAVILNKIPRFHSSIGWYWAIGWTSVVAMGAILAAVAGGLNDTKLIPAVGVLVFLMVPYFLTAFSSVRRDLANWFYFEREKGLVWALGFLILQYLIYASGTASFSLQALLRLLVFIAVPLILVLPLKGGRDISWRDFAAMMAIWLPFNFGLLDEIWTWPEGKAAYILNTPLAMNLAIILFLGWRNFSFVNLRFNLKIDHIKVISLYLLGFIPVALVIGLSTKFLAINPQLSWPKVLGTPLGIFFFIAVPEEFLFRGLIQGFFLEKWRRPVLAVLATAVLFGVSHWHNPGLPDLRYIGLATLAGIFYGTCYHRTESLAAAALLHASVDTLWEWFFHT